MKKTELLYTAIIFVATACIIMWITSWAIDVAVQRNICEHTPMNQMTGNQWHDCLELIK